MFQWTDEQLMLRDAVRRFMEAEVEPHLDDLEHGDLPPYDILRKLLTTFGMDAMSVASFEKRIAKEKAIASGEIEVPTSGARHREGTADDLNAVAFQLLPIIELCRYCPGMVTAMGVSIGLTAGAINAKGTIEQRERWVPDILTMTNIGAWAITEPDSGSDAFGGMKASAVRDGDEFILNGSKTFITNGPFADTIVFICKLDEGNPVRERRIVNFVLDRGTPGLEQTPPMRKMGMHSSPTGQLFLDDVRVGADRLLGGLEGLEAVEGASGKDSAKGTFSTERSGVAAMALGIVERCLELSTAYARDRVQWDQPIGNYQLIQLKLAKMEVARMNLENLVFRFIEQAAHGVPMTFAEASAMKLYSAQTATDVALEAVQLFGGNGYMSEYRVEQLARDAKVLQIYAGTDEMQIRAIARDLLDRDAP